MQVPVFCCGKGGSIAKELYNWENLMMLRLRIALEVMVFTLLKRVFVIVILRLEKR